MLCLQSITRQLPNLLHQPLVRVTTRVTRPRRRQGDCGTESSASGHHAVPAHSSTASGAPIRLEIVATPDAGCRQPRFHRVWPGTPVRGCSFCGYAGPLGAVPRTAARPNYSTRARKGARRRHPEGSSPRRPPSRTHEGCRAHDDQPPPLAALRAVLPTDGGSRQPAVHDLRCGDDPHAGPGGLLHAFPLRRVVVTPSRSSSSCRRGGLTHSCGS